MESSAKKYFWKWRNECQREKHTVEMGQNDITLIPMDVNRRNVLNRFGTAHFKDDQSAGKKSVKYVFLDDPTNPADVWTILSEVWEIRQPEMIISLTGGQRNYGPHFENQFKKSLINIATKTDAWIITDGVETGIVKLVGEAVSEYKVSSGHDIVTIGIARWGTVSNRSELQGDQGEGEHGGFPAHCTVQEPSTKEKSAPLNPNHTHFLLVNTSTEKEIALRTGIERSISSNVKWISGDTEIPVPVIRLTFNGQHAMKSALKAAKEGITVIFIKDMKRLISISSMKVYGDKKVPRTLHKRDGDKHILIAFMDQHDIEIDHGLEKECLQIMLETMKIDAISQLELAIKLGNFQVYMSHLDIKQMRELQSLNLNKALMDALLQDSSIFISFILEQNDNWKSLTGQQLWDLYFERSISLDGSSSPHYSLLMKTLGFQLILETSWTLRINKIIKQLVGGNVRNIYTDEDSSDGKAAKDIFLWAVLMNFPNSARIFIRKCKNPIGGALTASSLMSGIAKKVRGGAELEEADKIEKEADYWEKAAYTMIDNCYKWDVKRARKLLVTNIDTWGNRTLFEMADSGRKMDFMGHSSCQTKLNDIWFDKLGAQFPFWKMFLFWICPMLIFTINFKDDENGTKRGNRVAPTVSEGNCTHRNCTPSCETVCKKFFWFYSAPCIKMCSHAISTLVFLGLFSFFLITNLHPMDIEPPSIMEYIVWGWAGTLLIEEIRQVVTMDAKWQRKLCLYWKKSWNKIDASFLILLFISVILRYTLHGDKFGWARIFYTFTLMMYFGRSLRFFYATKHIGPKVIMFGKMIKELGYVSAILLTVITGYGVAVQSLRHQNRTDSLAIFTDVFFNPYFHIYGELFLNETDGAVIGCDQTLENCQEEYWIASFLFAFYLVFILLLLNLFIALFSFILKDVLESAEKLWQFYRYDLICEYLDKPTLAPPLIILNHLWRFYWWIRSIFPGKYNIDTGFRITLRTDEMRKLSDFERRHAFDSYSEMATSKM